jgi:hypothetical protein
MIQRIQTIYLALILFLSVFFLTGSVFTCVDETGQTIRLMITGALTDKSGVEFARVALLWPLIVDVVLLVLTSAAAIFLFKRRSLQIGVTMGVIFLSFALAAILAAYARVVTVRYHLSVVPGLKLIIPVLIIVFAILALRGIRKDDQLVKSYDRLR